MSGIRHLSGIGNPCMLSSGQLRAARALLGVDQKRLAELAGVSLPTIQRMEASGRVERKGRARRAVANSSVNRTPTFAELFTPKLVTVLREGYRLKDLRADAVSGLTVAVVALPLSMAIAIASHLTPEQGLFTAIVGGFLVSALGGSRFQIGGPAGAFIVLVASIVDRHGYGGLAVATAMAGLVLMAARSEEHTS